MPDNFRFNSCRLRNQSGSFVGQPRPDKLMVLCGLNESNFQVWKSLEGGEEQNGAVCPTHPFAPGTPGNQTGCVVSCGKVWCGRAGHVLSMV